MSGWQQAALLGHGIKCHKCLPLFYLFWLKLLAGQRILDSYCVSAPPAMEELFASQVENLYPD